MKKKIVDSKLIKSFCLELQRQEKSKATIEKYKRQVEVLSEFLAGSELTKDRLIAFKSDLQERNYSDRTINSFIASTNSFLTFLKLEQFKLKSLRLSNKIYCDENRELSRGEYKKLVETAQRKGDERTSLLIQTFAATGIRVSELEFITFDSLCSGEAKIRNKGRTRIVFIVPKLRRLLLDYCRRRDIKAGAVFVSKNGTPFNRTTVWRIMKSLCVAAGVQSSKVFPHNFRHLFARCFYDLEKDIAKLADILGHGDINTTRIYLIESGQQHRRKLERMNMLIPPQKEKHRNLRC